MRPRRATDDNDDGEDGDGDGDVSCEGMWRRFR